ncbi:hypothetical protein RchiOBHm_Chr5g0035781 [Rosa chinensis]|uniref:Uncharacterized protein n=1 Tax=Rosa chinensis TaxID=74649 RepID=A0A2P6QBC0_ROSCH|nr:hypothetical protein RchiOBHm_Chr5g0035781 [Rosa chinensis]
MARNLGFLLPQVKLMITQFISIFCYSVYYSITQFFHDQVSLLQMQAMTPRTIVITYLRYTMHCDIDLLQLVVLGGQN